MEDNENLEIRENFREGNSSSSESEMRMKRLTVGLFIRKNETARRDREKR